MTWIKQFIGLMLIWAGAIVHADLARVNGQPLVYGKHDMVVTTDIWASKAASQILKQGGNAVDAATAAAFVLGLTEPQYSGMGGGGFALTYNKAKKKLNAYDGREIAPASANPNLFLDPNDLPITLKEAILSTKSIGIPAEVALLFEMHRKEGQLAWSKVVRPAINLAIQGFPMGASLHDFLEQDQSIFMKDPPVQAIYFTEKGNVKPIGTLIKNIAYANSLALIAENPRKFYTGQIAKDIVTKINHVAGHNLYNVSDMIHYKPLEGSALCSDYRTYKICSIPFASGGVSVLELLKIYAKNYAGKRYSDPGWVYNFLEASKLTYADRDQYIADPNYVQQPLEGLIAPDYILKRSKLITNKPLETPVPPGIPHGADSKYAPDRRSRGHGTTSIAVVDAHGNAVSMTITVGYKFGSHVHVDGFFLNNELTDFSFAPMDKHGKAVANRAEAFKRPRSAIAPTMVFDKNNQLIVISGSPGGSRIICYVTKSLIHMLDFNRNAIDSAASGNLCALNDTPIIEKSSDLVRFISKSKLEQVYTLDLKSGIVNIERAANGGWYGAADPRRVGMAIGD